MVFDGVKALNLLYEAILQALITAGAILITYKLGKMQSDRDWARKLAYDKRERERELAREETNRKIEALRNVIKAISLVAPFSLYSKDRILTYNENKHSIIIAYSLYEHSDREEIKSVLLEMMDLVWAFYEEKNKYFNEVIMNELTALEAKL